MESALSYCWSSSWSLWGPLMRQEERGRGSRSGWEMCLESLWSLAADWERCARKLT